MYNAPVVSMCWKPMTCVCLWSFWRLYIGCTLGDFKQLFPDVMGFDASGGTRTCIHTPGPRLHPSEITPQLLDSLLQNARLVYFDGRMAEAALVVAEYARQKQIPVSRMKCIPCGHYKDTNACFLVVWFPNVLTFRSTAVCLKKALLLILPLYRRGNAHVKSFLNQWPNAGPILSLKASTCGFLCLILVLFHPRLYPHSLDCQTLDHLLLLCAAPFFAPIYFGVSTAQNPS